VPSTSAAEPVTLEEVPTGSSLPSPTSYDSSDIDDPSFPFERFSLYVVIHRNAILVYDELPVFILVYGHSKKLNSNPQTVNFFVHANSGL
jgi:hypothetical protein